MKPGSCSPQTSPKKRITKKENIPKIQLDSNVVDSLESRHQTYLMPGRSLALVAMSADSGHNFSISSSGPQMDLFCPMKDFLAEKSNNDNVYLLCCWL